LVVTQLAGIVFLYELPLEMEVNLLVTARILVPLSIICVPMMVFLQARLCMRGRLSLALHVTAGMTAAAAAMVMALLADWLFTLGYWPWLYLSLAACIFPLLVAGLVGAGCCAAVWQFIVRPLRSAQKDMLGAFD